MRDRGITVVVPTFNGAARLPGTLAALAAQATPASLPWEVVVVDNRSTDGTGESARALWPTPAPAPLRVVREEEPGAGFAFSRGLAEASFGIVCTVDDDNRLAPDYLAVVSRVFEDHPRTGALGGVSRPVLSLGKPPWFDGVRNHFAVGAQGEGPGPARGGVVWGAGSAVRRDALRALSLAGWKPLLVGRVGNSFRGGEDTERVLALGLAGWEIRFEPDLVMDHWLDPPRVTWDWVRRNAQGQAEAKLVTNLYRFAREDISPEEAWKDAFRHSRTYLLRKWHYSLLSLLGPGEGNARVLRYLKHRAALRFLKEVREEYPRWLEGIRAVDWDSASPRGLGEAP